MVERLLEVDQINNEIQVGYYSYIEETYKYMGANFKTMEFPG